MDVNSQSNVRPSDEERLDWVRLIRSENVGPRTFRALLHQFGSAHEALMALPTLARRGGASNASRICSRADAEREIKQAKAAGISLVALGEPHYPFRLAMIDDPPPLISVRGDLAVLERPMIAVVGARNASAAGIKYAGRLVGELGEAGLVVVSGLARGIDAAAHRASLSSGTVAVLAGGHNRLYPPDNVELAGALLSHGVQLSEMPLDHEPRAHDFPRRNRLISGLSLGVVIVEAARGTLIHHYTLDKDALDKDVNLIVATTNNYPAICMSIRDAARGLIHGGKVDQGILNMIEMAFRAYDPCFGCATHFAIGQMPLKVNIYDSRHNLIKTVKR